MANNINKSEAAELMREVLSELVFAGSFDDELISRLYIVKRLDSVLEFLED